MLPILLIVLAILISILILAVVCRALQTKQEPYITLATWGAHK